MNTPRLHELFDDARHRTPGRDFLILPDPAGLPASTMGFDQLGTWVDALEAELRGDGVRPGDRVLAVAENCPEHIALILACSRIGAWSCGINARMAAGEVDAFAAMADARVRYYTTGVSPAARTHGQRHAAAASVLGGLARSTIKADAEAESGELGQAVVALIFTSGTSGMPKAVMVPHEALTHFARVSARSRDLGPQDRCYACVPMTHIFGLGTVLASSLYAGASLVMRPAFEPQQVLRDLRSHGVTQLQGPPTMFSRLLDQLQQAGATRVEAPALRYLYAGAAPLDLPLKLRVESVFHQPLHHGYGLSEYAGSAAVTRLGEWRKDTSSGYVVEGAQLRIVDPSTGRDVPVGARGEIWIRGVGLMPGYFRDPAASASAIRAGGWYASGDLGELREDGALFVVGRLKEMIVRSGFNVYPAEVEAALNSFASVARSAVVGRREQDGNESVLAFVELNAGAVLDEEVLQQHLRERLAPYKIPAAIRQVQALPMTPNGKILKRALIEGISA